MRATQALVLAAGEGSRLRPLTEHVPKPMLPIDGRPVVSTVLDQLSNCGVDTAAVVTGYLGEVLRSFLGQRTSGPDLWFVDQPSQDGSAHALQCALDQGLPRVATVVVASDTVWLDDDIAHLIDHAATDDEAIVTMALRRWPIEQLPHRSRTDIDNEGRLTRVLTQPSAAEAGTGATALSGSPLYVFASEFWEYVAGVTPSVNGKIELASALQQAIDDGRTVRGVEVSATRDLTRPNDLLRHNHPYLNRWLPEL